MSAKKKEETTDEAWTPRTPGEEKAGVRQQTRERGRAPETAADRQQAQGAKEANNKGGADTQDWNALTSRALAAMGKIREAYGPRTEDPKQWRWFLLGVTHTWKRIARVAKSRLPLDHKDEETNLLVLWESEESPRQAKAMAASIVTMLEKSIMRAIHRALIEEEEEAEAREQREMGSEGQQEEDGKVTEEKLREQKAEQLRPRRGSERDRLEELVAEIESTAEYLRSGEFDEDIEAENQAQLALDGLGKVGTRTWHEWKKSGARTAGCRVATWRRNP